MILRTGRIDDNVLDRSVIKRLGPVLNRKTQAVGTDSTRMYADSCAFRTDRCGMLSVIGAVNGLVADGYLPEYCRTDVLLPVGTEEALLRSIEDDIRQTVERTGISVAGGHTEVTEAVNRPIVMTQVCGSEPLWEACGQDDGGTFPESESSARAGAASSPVKKDIMVLGHIGLEGTFLLACEKRDEMVKRFPVQMVERAAAMQGDLLMLHAARALKRVLKDVTAGFVQPFRVSLGGIYNGLWKLAKELGCGFEVNMTAIPVYQETIEICGYYDINPYQMASEGCFLVVTEEGKGRKLQQELLCRGICARLIGHTTADRDKIIVNGEEHGNLNRPAPDSLIPILG